MKIYKPTKKEKRDALDRALDRLAKRPSFIKRKYLSLKELKKFIEKKLRYESL
jgi:hypothetical protein